MAPPEKKAKKEPNPNSISMVVEKWKEGQTEQISPVHRIGGYPWRLRLYKQKAPAKYCLAVVCDKSTESDLWKCTATIAIEAITVKSTFCSWEAVRGSCAVPIFTYDRARAGKRLQADLKIVDDGDSWRLRTAPDSIGPPDAMLVVDEAQKKIPVNKQFLASQSPFFDRLFFGDFKEKNMHRIPIGGVEFKDFLTMIKIVYGKSDARLTNENLISMLDLADRFDLKVVEDRAVSFVLSGRCSLTMGKKLLLSQERNLPFIAKNCLKGMPDDLVGHVFRRFKKEPEYAQFTDATKAAICDHFVNSELFRTD